MDDLISVIIPVYNVERYLRQCVDSVINQTYRNLQIILVNDGSTDSCGRICKEYEEKDQRILTVHQENQGLSAARNTGLKYAEGSYILFLDSDDYIEKTTCETLLNDAHETESDMVVGAIQTVDEDGTVLSDNKKVLAEKRTVLDQHAAMRELMWEHQIKGFAWGKLYKKELLDGIQFPVGRAFEDRFTVYQYVERASRICLSEGGCTYYRIRQGSILHNANLRKWYDLIEAEQNLISYCQEKFPDLQQEMEAEFYARLVHMWICFYDSGNQDEIQKLLRLMKQVYHDYKSNPYIKKVHRWSYVFIFRMPGVYRRAIHLAHMER